MKTSVIFLFCLMFTFIAFGQNEKKEQLVNKNEANVTEPKLALINDVELQLYSSNSAVVKKFFMEHIKYPENAAECCKQGTEVVEFVITPEGNVTDFNIINSVCCDIDDEVIRVLEKTNGMWKPAVKEDQPVPMKQEIALAFSMCRMEIGPINKEFSEKVQKYYTWGNESLFDDRKPKRALRHFNNGIRLQPYEKSLLYMRGLCKYELGDKEGARKDWDRLKDLGGIDNSEYFVEGVTELKGYEELLSMLQTIKQ